jgi:hypothetical protein
MNEANQTKPEANQTESASANQTVPEANQEIEAHQSESPAAKQTEPEANQSGPAAANQTESEASQETEANQTEPLVCPICGRRAGLINPPSFDARSIRCEGECGDYDISGNTWESGLLNGLSRDQRRQALTKARKLNPSARPRIISYAID